MKRSAAKITFSDANFVALPSLQDDWITVTVDCNPCDWCVKVKFTSIDFDGDVVKGSVYAYAVIETELPGAYHLLKLGQKFNLLRHSLNCQVEIINEL